MRKMRILVDMEEIFGWLKTVGGLRQSRHNGRAKLAGQMLLGCAAFNLVGIGSRNGWWDTRAVHEASICPQTDERRNESPDSGLKTRK